MKIKFGIHFVGIILISTACSEKKPANTDDSIVQNPEYGMYQNYENPPISFELLDSIVVKLPDDQIISGISFLQTDLNSNIYFFDRRQSKLISYSASGEFRWETGQKGKGPGDFENVYSMISNGEHIFIGNIFGTRIDLFSFSGEFMKSYNTGNGISFGELRGFNNKNELILTSTIRGKLGSQVHFLSLTDDSVQILNTIELVDKGYEPPAGMSVAHRLSISKNNIITTSVLEYSVKFYNDSAEVAKEITRDFDKIMRPGSYRSGDSVTLSTYGGLRSPLFLPDGHFISFVSWPTNVADPDNFVRKIAEGSAPEIEDRHSIDIFNKDGNLLYSFEGDGQIPSIGSIAYVDHNGIIYTTSAGEEAVIYRYKLNLPEAI